MRIHCLIKDLRMFVQNVLMKLKEKVEMTKNCKEGKFCPNPEITAATFELPRAILLE